MSWFGNTEKDRLLEELELFLENHTVGEMLDVVKAAVKRKEEQ